MTAAVALPRTGFKFMLTVRSGPDKGSSYQLLPPRVTIGRGPDNHVVLSDPRVSRQAIAIEFSVEKIVVIDMSGRNALYVNNELVIEASIKDGDVLRTGDSDLSFIVEALPLPSVRGGDAMPNLGIPPRATSSTAARAQNDEKAKKMRFYGIVLVILMTGAYLATTETAKRDKPKGPRTVEEFEAELKTTEKRLEELVVKRQPRSAEERTRMEEAQKHFLQGFRDYQKNQHGRAMRSFETARAIDPANELAGRYYALAAKQRDEMIAGLSLEGRRYHEKNMFIRCSAAFEKVLDLIPNKDDVKYKTAEALKKECDARLDDRFRK